MKLHSEYRKDWRSDAEYANDIMVGHKTEQDIIQAYAKHLRHTQGIKVTIKNNGVDNSGKVIDAKDVTTDADFIVNGELMEVKFMNNYCKNFRFKEDQLHSYIRQGATVLFVNGWKTDRPVFTLMDTKALKDIAKHTKAQPFEGWGNKRAYFLRDSSFTWKKFSKKSLR